ncbi:MAG: RHS repeat protein [Acidobacteria bacterium]|nr:RHS repeat protein [Acidobacteriota bacterium]
MGRLVKHVQTIGDQSYQLEYGYNLAGQLTSQKYPSGRVVTAGYDSKGRLSTVADAQRTFLASVGFGSDTLPSQLTYGNTTVQNFVYSGRLQMTSQELKKVPKSCSVTSTGSANSIPRTC